MRISRFNHEGYYDPTTYRAFKNIDKDEKRKARFRPIVYICSPYAGSNKEKNIANAIQMEKYVHPDMEPYASMLDPYEKGMDGGLDCPSRKGTPPAVFLGNGRHLRSWRSRLQYRHRLGKSGRGQTAADRL